MNRNLTQVEKAIREAFIKLMKIDGVLFECPFEDNSPYVSRKLHEVCINHKLAIYLEEFLFPEMDNEKEKFFTDIEFNREGSGLKNLTVNEEVKRVRPDIIIQALST